MYGLREGLNVKKPKGTLLSFSFSLNEMRTVHKREVYNLLDLLGDLGGVAASNMLLGYVAHELLVG